MGKVITEENLEIDSAINFLNHCNKLKTEYGKNWYSAHGSTFILCAIDHLKNELKNIKKQKRED